MRTCDPTGGSWMGAGVARTGGLRIGLRDMELAHNLENQISALVADAARVQQVFELGIELQPSVSIPVRLVPHAVGIPSIRGIHNGSRDGDAGVLHNEPVWMVHVIP